MSSNCGFLFAVRTTRFADWFQLMSTKPQHWIFMCEFCLMVCLICSCINLMQHNAILDGIEMHMKYTRHLRQNYSIDNRQYEIPVHTQIRMQQRWARVSFEFNNTCLPAAAITKKKRVVAVPARSVCMICSALVLVLCLACACFCVLWRARPCV